MATIPLNTLREKFPGKSDWDIAAALAERYKYEAIVRYKHQSSSTYDHFGCCSSQDQAAGYLNNPNCKDPELIYGQGAKGPPSLFARLLRRTSRKPA